MEKWWVSLPTINQIIFIILGLFLIGGIGQWILEVLKIFFRRK